MASAVVVYESVFGDAEKIARAVAEGLSAHLDVVVVAAKDAPQHLGPDVRLLVVGGPNHAMSMPRPSTDSGARSASSAWLASAASRASTRARAPELSIKLVTWAISLALAAWVPTTLFSTARLLASNSPRASRTSDVFLPARRS